ncbi:hypothetical protein C8J57DRAFT_1578874 [Mycena rebaudengoi]|nr:hypothetical protein C8J57DRAFT_1578874 [Mycena rebaudengoi]
MLLIFLTRYTPDAVAVISLRICAYAIGTRIPPRTRSRGVSALSFCVFCAAVHPLADYPPFRKLSVIPRFLRTIIGLESLLALIFLFLICSQDPPPNHRQNALQPWTKAYTLESLRSWWSDSNPNLRGPTINLHAAAKPLMKFLYDRQALEFIRNNRDILLSAKDAEIYGSYLSCEYISASTKSAILEDLDRKAYYSDHDALAVQTDARVPPVVDGLLLILYEIPQITFLPVTTGVSVEAKLLDHLSDMLKDSSTPERHYLQIFGIISKLARHESTAVAVVEANILNSMEKLLKSRPDVYPDIFTMVKLLASHAATAEATDMLEAPNTGRYLRIFRILSHLALHESGAVAILEANVLNSVENLLRSRPTDLYEHIFSMLERLASYESTAMAVVRMLPLEVLGSLWRKSIEDKAPIDILASRLEALVTTKLMGSPHRAIAETTCGSFVALMCENEMPNVVYGALWALSLAFPISNSLPNTPEWWHPVGIQILSNLALHEATAVAIVEANTLNAMEKLLRSRRSDLYQHIFLMLENLASHESTAMAIPHMIPVDQFSTRLLLESYRFPG